ncbi:MAG: hypothetical protein QMD36_04575 [Candidatus Aenigmarchaeota archaeon]|nr:hypothetical protein [Candidatus Aenigmarchaeota archaeon]
MGESKDRCPYCGCFTTDMDLHLILSCKEIPEFYKEEGYRQKPVLKRNFKEQSTIYKQKSI